MEITFSNRMKDIKGSDVYKRQTTCRAMQCVPRHAFLWLEVPYRAPPLAKPNLLAENIIFDFPITVAGAYPLVACMTDSFPRVLPSFPNDDETKQVLTIQNQNLCIL